MSMKSCAQTLVPPEKEKEKERETLGSSPGHFLALLRGKELGFPTPCMNVSGPSLWLYLGFSTGAVTHCSPCLSLWFLWVSRSFPECPFPLCPLDFKEQGPFPSCCLSDPPIFSRLSLDKMVILFPRMLPISSQKCPSYPAGGLSSK
jgi:hypothetical protein